MRLSLDELVRFDPERARVTLNDRRVIVIGAEAMGQLRRDLIANLGIDRTRGFLTRYGWNCGHNDALAVRDQLGRVDAESLDWLEAGMRLHAIEGIARVELVASEIDRDAGTWYKEAACHDSYEAEQHALHFGLQSSPVCWVMVGYASGYTTAYFGRPVYYRETACVGCGDSHCYLVGMTPEQWGPEAAEDLAYYSERLVGEELEEAYARIREQRDELEQIVGLQDRLAGMILGGEDLESMVRTLSEQLDLHVVVEDRLGHPIAAWPTVGNGARAADPGLSLVAAGNVIGRVLVSPSLARSGGVARVAAQQATAVCGLALMRDRVAANADHRLQAELFDRLLTGDASGIESVARFTGMLQLERLDQSRVVVVELDAPAAETGGVLDELAQDAPRRWPACRLALARGGRLTLLAVDADGEPLEAMCDGLRAGVEHALPSVSARIGIGGASTSAADVARSYQQALRAVRLASARDGHPLRYDDLGVHLLLAEATTGDDLHHFAGSVLCPLIERDGDARGVLLDTLRAYLDERGRIKGTAARLNVHISTLKYRLGQIEELTGLDLHDGEHFFRLGLALRIRDGEELERDVRPNG